MADRSSRLAPSAPEMPTYGWPTATDPWHKQAQTLRRKRDIVLNLQGGGGLDGGVGGEGSHHIPMRHCSANAQALCGIRTITADHWGQATARGGGLRPSPAAIWRHIGEQYKGLHFT